MEAEFNRMIVRFLVAPVCLAVVILILAGEIVARYVGV